MADLPPAGDPSDLERRRLALEERKLALEESWPKKWGAVTIGAAATLAAALATGGLGYFQHATDNHRADTEAAAQAQVATINAANAQAQKRLENDRAAVAMYLQYLAGDQAGADPALQAKLNLVDRIASDPSLLAPFLTAKVTAGSAAGDKPSDVLRGSPNLIAPQAAYNFGDFVAYIQYARDDTTAQATAKALEATANSLGFNTPGAAARRRSSERERDPHLQARARQDGRRAGPATRRQRRRALLRPPAVEPGLAAERRRRAVDRQGGRSHGRRALLSGAQAGEREVTSFTSARDHALSKARRTCAASAGLPWASSAWARPKSAQPSSR